VRSKLAGLCIQIAHKKKANCLFTRTSKVVLKKSTKFARIALAMNAMLNGAVLELYRLHLTSRCSLPCNMPRDKIVTKE